MYRNRMQRLDAKQINADMVALGMNPAHVADMLYSATGIRQDSAETIMFSRELLQALKVVHEIQYPELKARQFLPVSHEVGPGQDSFKWEMLDAIGTAKVGDMADDFPMADVVSAELIQAVKSVTNGFGWDIQELEAAAVTGKPLQTRKAESARMAFERAIELIAGVGVPAAGLPGLLKNANVPIVAGGVALVGAWTTGPKTPAQILSDMNIIANNAASTTSGAFRSDTLLLPLTQFLYVSSTPWSTTGDGTTILQQFLKNQAFVTNVDWWAPLATADAANTGPRAVAYKRNPQSVQLHIPVEFRTLPPQARNFRFVVPCYGRCAGVSLYQPLDATYADGI